MAFHQLGAPELPIFQEHAERFLSMRIAVAAKKFARGGRSAGARIEQGNVDFTIRERAVDERQVADYTSEEAKAEAGFGNNESASDAGTRNHVAKAECEKGCSAEVGIGPEVIVETSDVNSGTGAI